MSEPEFRRMRRQLMVYDVVVSIPTSAKKVGEKEIRKIVSENKKEMCSLKSPMLLNQQTEDGVVNNFVLGDVRQIMNRPDYWAKFYEMTLRLGSVSDVVALNY